MNPSNNDKHGRFRFHMPSQPAVFLGMNRSDRNNPWYRSVLASRILTLWCIIIAFSGGLVIVRAFLSNSLPLDTLLPGHSPIQTTLDPAAVSLGRSLPDGVELTTVTGTLHVHIDIVDRLLSIVAVLPFTIVVLIALILVRHIVVLGRDHDPFVSATPRRLDAIAYVVGAGGLLALLMNAGAVLLILNRSGADQFVTITVDTDPLLWVIILGSLIWGLSAVFKEGVRMRADIEGLV